MVTYRAEGGVIVDKGYLEIWRGFEVVQGLQFGDSHLNQRPMI